jgi:hypothetical protein
MTKKLKVLAVMSALWLLAIFATAVDEYPFRLGKFTKVFILFGVVPVVIAWGIVWIRRTPSK